MGTYNTSCARPGEVVIFNFWYPGTLTFMAKRQIAQMSKITNDWLSGVTTGWLLRLVTGVPTVKGGPDSSKFLMINF